MLHAALAQEDPPGQLLTPSPQSTHPPEQRVSRDAGGLPKRCAQPLHAAPAARHDAQSCQCESQELRIGAPTAQCCSIDCPGKQTGAPTVQTTLDETCEAPRLGTPACPRSLQMQYSIACRASRPSVASPAPSYCSSPSHAPRAANVLTQAAPRDCCESSSVTSAARRARSVSSPGRCAAFPWMRDERQRHPVAPRSLQRSSASKTPVAHPRGPAFGPEAAWLPPQLLGRGAPPPCTSLPGCSCRGTPDRCVSARRLRCGPAWPRAGTFEALPGSHGGVNCQPQSVEAQRPLLTAR
mmetsp:Transcript_107083/g.189657  ORF Transcript_107083/g.189657 Transcript_107083/m.189657 type:complete len:296 (+) Transcript_107083:181-1068(+)